MTPSPAPPKRSSGARSTLLLMALVLGVGLAGTWLLGPVGAPNVLLAAALAILGFVGVQWLVFRVLGLRSAADQADEDDDPTPPDDVRAWRG